MALTLRQNLDRRLTIPEMDDNLIYLEKLAKTRYINFFDNTSESTTPLTLNNWIKIVTNTSSTFDNNGLTHTNNRITNDGETGVFKITTIVSGYINDALGHILHLAIFKNGVLVSCSEQATFTITNVTLNLVSSVSIQCIVQLQPGDYIEVFMKEGLSNVPSDFHLMSINTIVHSL